MVELRDSIKANWATTGQELTKDFRQFWQSSRPASPARTPTRERTQQELAASATSPTAVSHLSHLEIPGRTTERGSSEFAAGYNLGLIGGVRAWVSARLRLLIKCRTNLHRWLAVAATSTTTAALKAPLTKIAQTSKWRQARRSRHVVALANNPPRRCMHDRRSLLMTSVSKK